jgi:UDP:flavonoid glycosyltransferase YjiC (YdhE family)
MHVLLAGFGTRGDVQPLLALALGLMAKGHTATVAAPPDFEASARALGIPFVAVGESISAYMGRISNDRAELVVSKALAAMPGWLRSQYVPLRPLVEHADVVVAASITIAPLDLAEKLGKRVYFVAYCPQIIPSSEHPMPFTSSQRLPGWLNRLSFWFAARGHDWNLRKPIDAERALLGLGPAPATWDHILFRNLVIASDPALAPLPADLEPTRGVRQLGAFYLEAREPLPQALERFLGAGDPPVYVGFGSMPDIAPDKTLAWVRSAAEKAGVRVVLLDASGFVDERVFCAVALNHQALFLRCAAVVHHGGAGTTAAAARAGVPQLFAPHVTDQFFWAERLKRLGVAGPSITPRKHDVDELAEALRRATADAQLRERARSLATKIRSDGVVRMVELLEGE